MSPLDSTDFWNPKLRGPVCYNPAAVRSILPYTILRTKLILSGLSKAEMVSKIQVALAGSLLPMPEPGAMSYMMSKSQYLGDSGGHSKPAAPCTKSELSQSPPIPRRDAKPDILPFQRRA